MIKWTKKEVSKAITHAFIILNRVGGPTGPQEYGNSLADHEGGMSCASIEVSKMEAVLEIITQEIENPDERKMLMEFHSLKAKGKKIEEICKKMQIPRRSLYRKIDLVHQDLIEAFRLNRCFRHLGDVDEVAQNRPNDRVKSELRQREKSGTIQGWKTGDARGSIEDFGASYEAAE